MNKTAKVLFLALNTFDSTGGVQKVCRTLCYCFKDILGGNFRAFCLHGEKPDPKYINSLQFKAFKGSKITFAFSSLIRGATSPAIIISHINLISIALLIRVFNKRSKIVLLAHGTEVWRNLPIWKKWFIKNHVHIWSVSNYTKQVLEKRHCIRKSSYVVSNCLDPFLQPPAKFDKPAYLIERYALSEDQPVLLTICRLSEHEHFKGYDQVIHLMKSLSNNFPDVRYLLCGESDQQEFDRLNHLILKNNLEQMVSLPGFIPDEELTDHYLLADLFILPSQKEGFGLVLIEAAVCGCRIISGNADGSPDAMLKGKLGTLINPADQNELYLAIQENLTFQNDAQMKKTMQTLTLKHFGYPRYRRKIKRMLFR
ncbi:MAG TPA: glycosyltransferase family 4 protein [Pedobacter sp.]|uniref:glycosyltransferase family 4 protein n=1 Tax=Pedobacter sp. TaxID=1411316 RepID=UPI002C74EDB5|nr:glycosyltransferase family 4 protein [Pedobacter sp.]HMI02656.1 glycosyltransferase family 4 protein [Pedobacter sp.]